MMFYWWFGLVRRSFFFFNGKQADGEAVMKMCYRRMKSEDLCMRTLFKFETTMEHLPISSRDPSHWQMDTAFVGSFFVMSAGSIGPNQSIDSVLR